MNWLGQPAPPRVRLLQDADLRGRVGFVGRVLHKDGEHSLDGWWLQLRRLLGRG